MNLRDFSVGRWVGERVVVEGNANLLKVVGLVDSYLSGFVGVKDLRLLDVGCGDGGFGELFVRRGIEVWGVDNSDVLVNKAWDRGVKSMLVDISEGLPYPSGFFDVVVCSEVIEHVFFTEALLSELRRVLRVGGLLVVTTPNLVCLKNRVVMLFGGHPDFFEYSEMNGMGHIRAYSAGALLKQVERVGFRNVVLTGSSFPFPHEWFGSWGKKLLPLLVGWSGLCPSLSAHSIVRGFK